MKVSTVPEMKGIDHVHVYVRSWAEALPWYEKILGFRQMEKFAQWAVDGGPLTLESQDGNVHLALFESDAGPNSTIAFGASGEQFLTWKDHLHAQGIELRISDHDLAWSLYFHDPFDNYHEITTYDHARVAQHLG